MFFAQFLVSRVLNRVECGSVWETCCKLLWAYCGHERLLNTQEETFTPQLVKDILEQSVISSGMSSI
jgi:hypothetical protein